MFLLRIELSHPSVPTRIERCPIDIGAIPKDAILFADETISVAIIGKRIAGTLIS